jgi:hypothetical protein
LTSHAIDPVLPAVILLLEHDSTVRGYPERVFVGSDTTNYGMPIDANNGELVFPTACHTNSNVMRLKHIAVSSEVKGDEAGSRWRVSFGRNCDVDIPRRSAA